MSTILEIVPDSALTDDQKELLQVAAQNGLLPETTQNLQSSFAPLFSQARSILEKSRNITVTDASQTLEINLARSCRLALKAVRIASDKTRKELKEESLKKGKAIDGFHNILLHLVEGEETRLDEQEKFAERKEAELRAALKLQREELLKPYAIDTTVFALGDMSLETFEQLLSGTKMAHEARAEAARKAEADRIAVAAAYAAEQARIKAENERLKHEAEQKEAELAAERARVAAEQAEAARIAKTELDRREALAAQERLRADAVATEIRRVAEEQARQEALRQQALREVERQKAEAERARLESKAAEERMAREKLEAEKAAAAKAESDRIAAEQLAARKAAAAPDREKLRAFAEQLWGMKLPELNTPGGATVLSVLKVQHEKYIAWVTKQGEGL